MIISNLSKISASVLSTSDILIELQLKRSANNATTIRLLLALLGIPEITRGAFDFSAPRVIPDPNLWFVKVDQVLSNPESRPFTAAAALHALNVRPYPANVSVVKAIAAHHGYRPRQERGPLSGLFVRA